MANFAVANSTTAGLGSSQAPLTTTYKTICCIAASSQANTTGGSMLRRGKLYDILVGTNGTPADNYVEYRVSRATVSTSSGAWAGALSSVSSGITLDQADISAAGLIAVNSSAETQVTLTSVGDLWYVGVNQRASYRWVAAPGSEFVYPATSSNGLVLQARSGGYTGTVTGTILFTEQ